MPFVYGNIVKQNTKQGRLQAYYSTSQDESYFYLNVDLYYQAAYTSIDDENNDLKIYCTGYDDEIYTASLDNSRPVKISKNDGDFKLEQYRAKLDSSSYKWARTTTDQNKTYTAAMQWVNAVGGGLSKLSFSVTVNKLSTKTCKYYDSDGTTLIAEKSAYYGNSITHPSSAKTGYTFNYWIGGNGEHYNANTTSVLYSDWTLTGSWTANTYKITLNNQGGNGSSSHSVVYNSNVSSITIPTRTNYSFLGYYTGVNGTGIKLFDENGEPINSSGYISNKKWVKTENITLYAAWKINNFIVTYNFNNNKTIINSDSFSNFEVIHGNSFRISEIIPEAEKKDRFSYWRIENIDGSYQPGDVVEYNDNIKSILENNQNTLTLMAYWSQPTYTIELFDHLHRFTLDPTANVVSLSKEHNVTCSAPIEPNIESDDAWILTGFSTVNSGISSTANTEQVSVAVFPKTSFAVYTMV